MDWIKVTPDTMPPDMEPVMLTVEDGDGKRYMMPECRYNPGSDGSGLMKLAQTIGRPFTKK